MNNFYEKIFFILSIIGCLTLLILSQTISPKIIQEMKKNDLEKIVSVEGVIKEIKSTKKITIIALENFNGEIIAFSRINLKKGDKIKVIGKLRFDKNYEIIADKIAKIS